MNRTAVIFLCLAVALVLFLAPVQAAAIRTSTGVFHDSERKRDVPYKLYEPAEAETKPLPVVIFSHGLGGSVEAAPYLGQALAANGYMAFFIQHPGSDKGVWEDEESRKERMNALKRSLLDTDRAADRYGDVPFVIDELTRLNTAEGPLKGRLDLNRIGMAGHSYGGRSTMMAAGEVNGVGKIPFKEPRIKAGVVLSPNVPRRHYGKTAADIAGLYKNITIPLFHMTGTQDGDPLMTAGKTFDPATRTLPYQAITTTDQYLLVLDGATHKTFGGGSYRELTDGAHQQIVAKGAVLFFDAYLKNDAAALEALRTRYKSSLTPRDRFEYKTVNR